MAKEKRDFLAVRGRVMEVYGICTDDGAIGHTLKSNVRAPDVVWRNASLEKMAKLRLFRRQVSGVVRIRGRSNRKLFDDFEIMTLQADHLAGIVSQQANLAHAEIDEDLRAEPVIAKIHRKPKPFVGLDRIEPLLLQLVGVNLWS